ncbi:hypothetical protein [Massilia aurea]|uniref:hypothetical protein n=1 Tax=Massilia aurea TaxID=373040 RepID=UPI0011CD42BA|nr:hypothetical protein [Massilia aurea]
MLAALTAAAVGAQEQAFDSVCGPKQKGRFSRYVLDGRPDASARSAGQGVNEEWLILFTQKPRIKVQISIEIEVESGSGFEDGIQ